MPSSLVKEPCTDMAAMMRPIRRTPDNLTFGMLEEEKAGADHPENLIVSPC